MIGMLRYFNKLMRHHQLLFALIGGFSLIIFWRGLWGLVDALTTPMYAGPDYSVYLFSFTASAIAGLLVLMATDMVIKELV